MVPCAGLSGINKPVIVADWLNVAKPEEDYIIILDADMIMRQPLDPVAMGVKPGEFPHGPRCLGRWSQSHRAYATICSQASVQAVMCVGQTGARTC
jgi:hypothetical protein